ncbi:hypothetical protein ACLOJK_041620 [Asimina triloba]
MPCDECRTKAMKIVAAIKGVNSVALDGEDKDQLVVIGEEVDSVNLTRKLRKKVGHTDIVAVEEKKDEKKDDKKDAKKDEKPEVQVITAGCHPYPYLLPVYDYDSSPTICSIL